MADGGDGFDGCIEVVQQTRGYRRWPDEVKARIVAESFQPGVRVVDVARRHGLAAHQLSDWRRQARQGDLVLPAEAMAGVASDALPAFVPVSVEPEDVGPPADADRHGGVITIEIGNDLVLRVPGNVPAERAAAVARALRGSA
ncbi:IS66-like element accessory protein TnpA [Fluviibacterium sp. S390]|uniref:IS66-like element accessory protein TnpA n=1 Tax=Fluviibacterium sp. S390 TaxID=3415139 RepID=UPI003C7D5C45